LGARHGPISGQSRPPKQYPEWTSALGWLAHLDLPQGSRQLAHEIIIVLQHLSRARSLVSARRWPYLRASLRGSSGARETAGNLLATATPGLSPAAVHAGPRGVDTEMRKRHLQGQSLSRPCGERLAAPIASSATRNPNCHIPIGAPPTRLTQMRMEIRGEVTIAPRRSSVIPVSSPQSSGRASPTLRFLCDRRRHFVSRSDPASSFPSCVAERSQSNAGHAWYNQKSLWRAPVAARY
jgi:hypothetical protein